MILSEEELRDLPADPDLAFAEFVTAALNKVDVGLEHEEADLRRPFFSELLGFLDAYEIELDIDRNPPDSSVDFNNFFSNLRSFLLYRIAAIKFKDSRDQKLGVITVVSLDTDFRSEITDNLTNIKKIVHNAKLTDRKKAAIFKHIAALELEINKPQTRTEALLSLYLEVTDIASEGAENLDPAISRLDRVMRIFARAKTRTEQEKLPPPDDTKLLDSPAHSDESDESHPATTESNEQVHD